MTMISRKFLLLCGIISLSLSDGRGDTTLLPGGGEEYYTYSDCPGFETNYYAEVLDSIVTPIPTVGQRSILSVTGYVKQRFYVDYAHVQGYHMGVKVLDLKREYNIQYEQG